MYEYKAKIDYVYDGDGTYRGTIDLGMKIYLERDMRLYGVDTPELRGEQYEAGIIVRDLVKELLLDEPELAITTHKDESGKYGRLLVDIHIPDVGDLANYLVSLGYAKRYTGGTKEPWTAEELNFIKMSKEL